MKFEGGYTGGINEHVKYYTELLFTILPAGELARTFLIIILTK
jgi:hypothetical protein